LYDKNATLNGGMIMKFVSVRDLRGRSAAVWRELDREGDLVITRNGKPIAIVSATDEENLEQSLRERRQARAQRAVKQLQERSLRGGRDKLSRGDIETEITAARKTRRR
jgi:prevent-host-death family protein